MESYIEMDTDSDEERELQELRELDAAIQSEGLSANEASLIYSSSAKSASSVSSSVAQEYYKIETALALNKLYDEKLIKLEKILVTRLNECRLKLSEIHGLEPITEKLEQEDTFRHIRCGKPYFKDNFNYPAPPNKDTVLMEESQMFDFSDMTSVPGWTLKDKSTFITLIFDMSREIQEKKLKSTLAQLKRDVKVTDNKSLQKEIKKVEAQIRMLAKKTLAELALPINEEYDWDAVANSLNLRHSAQEYRALWKLYLHPKINKNSWKDNEHMALQQIAQAHRFQDWDTIAEKLNTGRTGYQCFVYFRTNMSNTFTGQKWTKEEELYLKRLIDYYKEDGYIPWGKVAASIENRTKVQIYNKYFRLIEERKGRFLPEEDTVILTCVDNFGANYRKITEFLPGRSAVQLRIRYQVLSKRRVSSVWTVEEDKKLINYMANRDTSINYSTISKHFPGKDRAHIRTRFMTLDKWMKKYPNKDLKHAPRRGARRLGHGCATANLNEALEKLKDRMRTEVDKKKGKRLSIESSEQDIEDAIIAALANEEAFGKKEDDQLETEESSNNESMVSAVSDVNLKKLLMLMRSKLDRKQFENSLHAQEHPGLLNSEEDNKFITIRSYSRKASTKTMKVEGLPDVWGNIIKGTPEYVLPPHLATITGCRKLMEYVNKTSEDNPHLLNLNLLSRRNPLLHDQIFNLMERFNILFTWPMLLSNKGPPISPCDDDIVINDEALGVFENETSTISDEQSMTVTEPEDGDIS